MKERFLELARRPRTWFIVVPALILVVALVGPLVWFRVVKDDPPPPLSFADVTTTAVSEDASTDSLTPTTTGAVTTTTLATAGRRTATTTATATATRTSEVEGNWRVGTGSIAGYRIGETVGLTSQDAVGRTEKVAGVMAISGASVASGSWTVDMVSVESDDDRRDARYREQMAVEKYPTSTFVLTTPLALGEVPADNVGISVPVKGNLTLRGVTRPVEFSVQARRHAGRVEVVGNIPVKFSDYNIPNPSNGYARTDDHGLVEFLLLFERA